MNPISQADWIDRCVQRLAEVDHTMDGAESMRLAQEMEQFERTRAMAPEAAVELLAEVMSHPGSARIERRLKPR